jgi:hypothetical protein
VNFSRRGAKRDDDTWRGQKQNKLGAGKNKINFVSTGTWLAWRRGRKAAKLGQVLIKCAQPETETTAGAAPAPDVLVDWPPNAIGSPRANKNRIDKAQRGKGVHART